MARDADVIISGGSFTGLALGLGLARALPGRGVVVLEREAPPVADGGRAFALSLSSKRLLEALGLWAALEADAQAVSGIDITDSGLSAAVRPVLLRYVNEIGAGEAASWIVPAARVLAVLRGAAAAQPGLTVRPAADVSRFVAGLGEAQVGCADGQAWTAALAIAADGRRSGLRTAAGIKVIGWDYGQTGIVTTIAHSRPHDGRAVQHFLPSGPFAILPLPGHRSCITWSEQRDEARRILGLDDASFAVEVDRRVAGRLGEVTVEPGRGSWPLEMHLARAFAGPRIAVAGDAAHGVHPIAGQGLNLGLKDVAALVEVVADAARAGLDIGSLAVLERYERWRRFDAVTSTLAYDALNRTFSTEGTLKRSLREFGLGLVDRLPFAKDLLVREAAGLTGTLPKMLTGVMP